MFRMSTGSSSKRMIFVLLISNERSALAITKTSRYDHDQIDQRPYPAASQSKQLSDCYSLFMGIKTMDSERTKKKTQQERGKPIIADRRVMDDPGSPEILGSYSAFWADYRFVIDLSATVRAVHRRFSLGSELMSAT